MSTSVDKLLGFQQLQRDFCDWVRLPTSDVPERLKAITINRLQTYHELLSHNMYQFVDMVFPVAQSMIAAEIWQHWCALFFQQARCQSPFYIDISQQFLEFMQQHPALWQAHTPWLVELLHYEWMELHVELAEFVAPDVARCLTTLDVASGQLLTLARPVWVLAYQWPVHEWQVGQDSAQLAAQPACLLVWRDDDDHIQQQLLTPLMAVLVEYLSSQSTFSQAQLQGFLAQQVFASQLVEQQQIDICRQVLQQLIGWHLLYRV